MGGYAAAADEFHPVDDSSPPASASCLEWWQRILFSGAAHASKPAEYAMVVNFCHGEENAHMGKVACLEPVTRKSAMMAGMSQTGP